MTSPSQPVDMTRAAVGNKNAIMSPSLSVTNEATAALVDTLPMNVTNTADAKVPVKKRNRRVGITAARKEAKLDNNGATGTSQQQEAITGGSSSGTYKVHSKHDEKWSKMVDALLEYKQENNSCTMVPQCYDQDPRLGRWVHYQRVEYWIYQNNGKGKITPERIARLEEIGFEWDPQRAQWNIMFKKLQEFAKENEHCKVPKGYTKDPELANWVRNQRLEYANLQRGKKTRMTADRVERLNTAGFKWSTAMPFRRNAGDYPNDTTTTPTRDASTSVDETSGKAVDKKASGAKAASKNSAGNGDKPTLTSSV